MLFKKRKLEARANQLVGIARIAAVTLLVPLFDRIPSLQRMLAGKPATTWGFFATVAMVGAGVGDMTAAISDRDASAWEDALRDALTSWDEQGFDAYLDLVGFVARNTEGGVDASTAIGAWVLWGIKAGEPTDEELGAAPIIGRALASSMAGAPA